MTATHRFPLTGMILEYWRMSDMAKASKMDASVESYRDLTLKLVRAAKLVNREAIDRVLRPHPIPHPWDGMGGLEQ